MDNIPIPIPDPRSPNLKKGRVVSVNISPGKGTSKNPVFEIRLIENVGVEKDAHAGDERQVSGICVEDAMTVAGFKPGLFAENITIEGIDSDELSVGRRIKAGEAEMEVTQLGKECPRKCSIYYKLGDCIMPRVGLFFKVIKGGTVRQGDLIQILESSNNG